MSHSCELKTWKPRALDVYIPGGGCVSLGHHARRCHWTSHWQVPQGPRKHQSPGWWPATEHHSSGTGWHSLLTSPYEAAGHSSAGYGRTAWSHPNCSEWAFGTGCSWRTHCLWRWPLTPPALRWEENRVRLCFQSSGSSLTYLLHSMLTTLVTCWDRVRLWWVKQD